MSTELIPGDRVSFEQNGRKLRGVITDYLDLKTRGEERCYPVVRPMRRKHERIGADRVTTEGGVMTPGQKVRWLPRSKLRKLPTPSGMTPSGDGQKSDSAPSS